MMKSLHCFTQVLSLVLLPLFAAASSPARATFSTHSSARAPAALSSGMAKAAALSKESLLYVQVYRDRNTVLSSAAHDHVIRAAKFTGRLAFDPQFPGKCQLSLAVPVLNLRVDEPWLRKKVGYPDTLSEDDRRSVRKNMLAPDQLNSKRFGTIRLAASRCKAGSRPDEYRALATVTLRGKNKRTTVTVRMSRKGGVTRSHGTVRLNHRDFGFEPYSAFLGAVRNAEPIDFVWSLKTEQAAQ